MVKYIIIPNQDGINHYYEIKFNKFSKYRSIVIENVCVIYTFKYNDHNYSIRAFSYKDKSITCANSINTKKKLIEQIELFLKGHVYPYFKAR